MPPPTTEEARKQRRAARQHRYYEAHRDVLKEKARARYDPERKSQYYLENRDDILEISRLRYVAQRAERVRAALEELATERPHHITVFRDIIDSGRYHNMKLKDVRALRTALNSTAPVTKPPTIPDIIELVSDEDSDGEPDVVELLRITAPIVPANITPRNEVIYSV